MVLRAYRIVIALLVVCIGISLGFNGFLYVQTVDLRERIEELNEQVSILSAQLSDLANTKNFTFELPGTYDRLVKIELMFKIVEENLSISAEVNDWQGDLIVVFDMDGNGTIAGDDGWLFYGGDPPKYRQVYDVDTTTGHFGIIMMFPTPSSPYHHATSTANATHFDILLPLNMLNLQNSLVYISKQSVSGRGITFDFGLEA